MDTQERIDIVICLRDISKNDNWDLRMVLRAIEKNLIGYGKIFIVTKELPSWINKEFVEHIVGEDTFAHNKDANIINKVIAACNNENVSAEFVRFSDDQLLLHSLVIQELKLYNSGALRGDKITVRGNWMIRLINAYEKLISEGKPHLNYEIHTPVLYQKEMFKYIFEKLYPEYAEEGAGYTINTMYFNNVESVYSVPLAHDKISFERKGATLNADEIKSIFDKKLWCGYNDKGFTPSLKKAILDTFSQKSKFELNDLPEEVVVEQKKTEENTIISDTLKDRFAKLMISTLMRLQALKTEAERKQDNILSSEILAQIEHIEKQFTIFEFRKYSENTWLNHIKK